MTMDPTILQDADHMLSMTMQPGPTILQEAEHLPQKAEHLLQKAESLPQIRTTFSRHRIPTYPYQSTTYHPNFLSLGIEKEGNTMMNPTYQNQVAGYTPLDPTNLVCLKGKRA